MMVTSSLHGGNEHRVFGQHEQYMSSNNREASFKEPTEGIVWLAKIKFWTGAKNMCNRRYTNFIPVFILQEAPAARQNRV